MKYKSKKPITQLKLNKYFILRIISHNITILFMIYIKKN